MATARGPRGRGTSWQIPHRNFPLPRPPRPDTPQGAHHCPCNGDPRSCLAHPFWPAPPRHPEPPAGPCPRPPPAGPQCAPQPARSRRPWAGAGRRNQDFQAPLGPATSPGPVSTLSSWHRPGTRARPAGDGPCARTGERWQQLGRGATLGGGTPRGRPCPSASSSSGSCRAEPARPRARPLPSCPGHTPGPEGGGQTGVAGERPVAPVPDTCPQWLPGRGRRGIHVLLRARKPGSGYSGRRPAQGSLSPDSWPHPSHSFLQTAEEGRLTANGETEKAREGQGNLGGQQRSEPDGASPFHHRNGTATRTRGHHCFCEDGDVPASVTKRKTSWAPRSHPGSLGALGPAAPASQLGPCRQQDLPSQSLVAQGGLCGHRVQGAAAPRSGPGTTTPSKLSDLVDRQTPLGDQREVPGPQAQAPLTRAARTLLSPVFPLRVHVRVW